ncbi:hypothetical protein LP7551_01047 [Roseibium album]|nr:hypothetical protein LP7551_01047 [Roseibium album]
MTETIEKLAAIPLPVWIGLICVITVVVIFLRATNPDKAKRDFKVSEPESPLSNGTPYGSGYSEGNMPDPRQSQKERLVVDPTELRKR